MKLIKTEEAYDAALERLNDIFNAPANTPEGDEAEVLMVLIEHYEGKHYPIEPPDPIEAIKFRMEQMGMKQKDLAQILGYKSRVSEVLNKKRKLTLEMIRKIHESLKIPYESLMSEYSYKNGQGAYNVAMVAEPDHQELYGKSKTSDEGSEEGFDYISINGAFEKSERENLSSPTFFLNWSKAIYRFAVSRHDKSMLEECIKKLKHSIKLNESYTEGYEFLGQVYGQLASLANEESYYKKSEVAYKKAITSGGSSYPLACFFVAMDDLPSALEHLATCLNNEGLKLQQVKNSSEWAKYLEDPLFIRFLTDFND